MQDGNVVPLEEQGGGLYRATIAASPFAIGVKRFESTPRGESAIGVVAQSAASDWNGPIALGRKPASLGDCIVVDSLKTVGTLYADDGPHRRDEAGEGFAIVGLNCLSADRLDRRPPGTFAGYVGAIEAVRADTASGAPGNLVRPGSTVQLAFVDLSTFCRQVDGAWSDLFGEVEGTDYDRVQLTFR